MRRLLIADADGELSKGIKKQLRELYQIEICQDGDALAALVCDFDPDILFLDMSMTGVDGFTLLQSLIISGRQTSVLVLLNINSDYILHRLERLGVQAVLTKPCKASMAVSHIRQVDFYLQHPDMKNWCLENEAENILLDLGFCIGKSRYHALCRAIAYKFYHNDSQMKEVYLHVANEQRTTLAQVEKAVRDAVIDAYNNGDPILWKMYFKPRRNSKTPYPTNEEFISRIVECLRQKTRLKKPYLEKAE